MMIPKRLKAKPRKPSQSKLSQVHRSQKALLRAFKHQTEEIGHLRREILAMRDSVEIGPGQTFGVIHNAGKHKITLTGAAKHMALHPGWWPTDSYSPTDSIDGPQPPLV